MWKMVLSLCLSLSLGCASFESTPSDVLSAPVNYVYDVPMSKGQLFDKSLMWAAQTYGSANDVIQYKDRNTGKIIGKGIGKAYLNLYDRGFSYTFNIDTKDKKVRLSFSNINRHDMVGRAPITGEMTQIAGLDVEYLECWNLAKAELDKIAVSYHQYLTKKADDF